MQPARDITIRRCTLRVMRRGGWSWGADAQTLAQRAIAHLPALLERGLSALGESTDTELDIAEPLQLRISLRRQDWKELIGSPELSAATRARLEDSIEDAMRVALPASFPTPADVARARAPQAPSTLDTPLRTESPASQSVRLEPSALCTLLSRWREEGVLLTQLASLDAGELRLWLDRLIEVESPQAASAPDSSRVVELWSEIRALPVLLPPGDSRTLAHQVIFVLELKRSFSIGAAQTRVLVDKYCVDEAPLPIGLPDTAAAGASADAAASAPRADGARLTTVPMHVESVALPATEADAEFELDVPCALPFLMLTPLSRTGYLTTLAATLEVARAGSLAGGVALALAHKCLAPPLRGWRREAGPLAAAAAFAGRQSCDNELIASAGRVLRPQLGILDNCVADLLLRGHRAEAGWLLARDASGTLTAFDEDGLVALPTAAFASLAARIAPSASVLFVPAHAANAEHLDALDELQIPYASDADLALRAATTSFIAPDGARLWISKHGSQQGRARSLAERGSELCAAALESWNAIRCERPAQRPGIDAVFEASLSVAACFALSAVAWSLWKNRARATALAAIEHFANLDARVRVSPDRVHVKLPMGRRAWDLRDRGLLADVRDVPWLDGRVVTFGVG